MATEGYWLVQVYQSSTATCGGSKNVLVMVFRRNLSPVIEKLGAIIQDCFKCGAERRSEFPQPNIAIVEGSI